jgi:hypothetical protein
MRGFSLILLVLVAVGMFVGAPDPDRFQRERELECAPVHQREDTDPEGWQMLIDQGYQPHDLTDATTIYPPGCESAGGTK